MTPTPSAASSPNRRQAAAAAATARRKLAKRALHAGNILLLVAADWTLQQSGIEAHRVAAFSTYAVLGVAALLLAAEWLPKAVDAFAPANRSALHAAPAFLSRQTSLPVRGREVLRESAVKAGILSPPSNVNTRNYTSGCVVNPDSLPHSIVSNRLAYV